MEVQVEISQWIGQMADLLPFGYAYGAGMVSAVNPCGFAMLPVYLTLYLGADDGEFRTRSLFFRML
ncbi:MAG: cytochrome c biogenesis CcdA family protein, partial [Desulforhopalus sp.]